MQFAVSENICDGNAMSRRPRIAIKCAHPSGDGP